MKEYLELIINWIVLSLLFLILCVGVVCFTTIDLGMLFQENRLMGIIILFVSVGFSLGNLVYFINK